MKEVSDIGQLRNFWLVKSAAAAKVLTAYFKLLECEQRHGAPTEDERLALLEVMVELVGQHATEKMLKQRMGVMDV